MAITDSPDFVRWQQIAVTVENEAVPEDVAYEHAATTLSTYEGTDTDYQTVVSWTVASDRIGILGSVELEADDYDYVRLRLTIAGEEQFADADIEAALTLEYPNLRLAAGAVVLLEAKSTDGTSIKVDGVILGKELG